jgi:ribonuclease HI
MRRFYIFSDGGARSNPGDAAYAFVVYDEAGNVIAESAGCLGKQTNNVAEYYGVLQGLAWIQDSAPLFGVKEVEFSSDSEVVVNHLLGEYECKAPSLRPLYLAANGRLVFLENMGIEVLLNHIPREKNVHADALVNRILDMWQGK